MQVRIGNNGTEASPSAASQLIKGYFEEHQNKFDYVRVNDEGTQVELKMADGHKVVFTSDSGITAILC